MLLGKDGSRLAGLTASLLLLRLLLALLHTISIVVLSLGSVIHAFAVVIVLTVIDALVAIKASCAREIGSAGMAGTWKALEMIDATLVVLTLELATVN